MPSEQGRRNRPETERTLQVPHNDQVIEEAGSPVGRVAPRLSINEDNSEGDAQVVHMTPGQAILLSKLSKPFTEQSSIDLKTRIAERKKLDQQMLELDEVGEAKLVDGQLVMDRAEKLDNDPKLAEGKVLPKTVADNFPKDLMGVPIEEVDPKHRHYDEVIFSSFILSFLYIWFSYLDFHCYQSKIW